MDQVQYNDQCHIFVHEILILVGKASTSVPATGPGTPLTQLRHITFCIVQHFVLKVILISSPQDPFSEELFTIANNVKFGGSFGNI